MGGLIALVAVAALALSVLVGLRLARTGSTLPGVHVSGVDVGGVAESCWRAAWPRWTGPTRS